MPETVNFTGAVDRDLLKRAKILAAIRGILAARSASTVASPVVSR